VDGRARSIGADFMAEAPALGALPADAFDCALTLGARVDRYARVCVRQCRYSVPARLIGRHVRVRLSAAVVEVFDASRLVAEHPRLVARGAERLVLDHYLEVLAGKPGAMPGPTPLAQARRDGSFTSLHEAFWAAARARHGDTHGTQALIEVLLLHRRLPRAQVLAGITAALAAGSVSADVVAIEARKAATGSGSTLDGATPETNRKPLAPRRSASRLVTLPGWPAWDRIGCGMPWPSRCSLRNVSSGNQPRAPANRRRPAPRWSTKNAVSRSSLRSATSSRSRLSHCPTRPRSVSMFLTVRGV
jgi:hypothetical protein